MRIHFIHLNIFLIVFSVILVSVLQIIDNIVDNNSALGFIFSAIGNPALLSLLGARLLFNMKEAGEKGLNQGMSCGSRSTVSGIDFVSPQAGTDSEQSRCEVEEGGGIELSEIYKFEQNLKALQSMHRTAIASLD